VRRTPRCSTGDDRKPDAVGPAPTGWKQPGIVAVGDWRAEDQPSQRPVTSDLGIYAAVGKKL